MRAFSVLELLVTIAVIAILLAVSLPALGHVRRVAQRVACEANIRSCSQALTCYARDHDDSLPMFAERRLLDAFTNGGYTLSYFYQSIHWSMVVRDYLTDRPLDEAQLCPSGPAFRTAFAGSGSYTTYLSDYPASYTQPSDYWLGYTMFTAPDMWMPGGPIDNERLLRPVRFSEILFPSLKGVLVEPRTWHIADRRGEHPSLIDGSGAQGPFAIAFADGSVASLRRSSLVPGYEDNGILPQYAAPVLATPFGARGRDR